MGNPHAGEVDLIVDGQRWVCKLTLGALAELESDLNADDIVALASRFETAKFSTKDILAVIKAGLRGAGWRGTAQDLLVADIQGGPVHAAKVAARLLALAFAPEKAEA